MRLGLFIVVVCGSFHQVAGQIGSLRPGQTVQGSQGVPLGLPSGPGQVQRPKCTCNKSWDPVCAQPPASVTNGKPKTFPNACEAACLKLDFAPGECAASPAKESEKCMYLECTPSNKPVCVFGSQFYDRCQASCVMRDYPGLSAKPEDYIEGQCPDVCATSTCQAGRKCIPNPGPCMEEPCLPYKCVDESCFSPETLQCKMPNFNFVCSKGITYTNKCFADCEGVTKFTAGPCPLDKRNPMYGGKVVPYSPVPGSPEEEAFSTGRAVSNTVQPQLQVGATQQDGCVVRRANELEQCGDRIGCFVSECEDNGSYKPVQCSGSTGYCWCVDAVGRKIPNTNTRGRDLTCGASQEEPSKDDSRLVCSPGLYFQMQGERRRCLPCPQGRTSQEGADECTQCPPGTAAPNVASEECTPCKVGKYAPLVGSTNCLVCPAGTTSKEGEPFCEEQDRCTAAAKDPCSCGAIEGCGWNSDAGMCVGSGITDCVECPSLEKCRPPITDVEAPAKWMGPPSAVRLLKVTGREPTSLQVQWVPPESRFNCGDTYRIQYRSGSRGSWETVLHDRNIFTKDPFVVINNLVPGKFYVIRVTPFRNQNGSALSGETSKVVGKTKSITLDTVPFLRPGL